MDADRSSGIAAWVVLAVFVCGGLALSTALVARANPSTSELRDQILDHPLDATLPRGFSLIEERTIRGEQDGAMHAGFHFSGPAHRNRILYVVFDSAPLARDDYSGHRESDRMAASPPPQTDRGEPPGLRARFFDSPPGVRDSFCRATGEWYGECVSVRGRIVVLAESSILPEQTRFTLPPGTTVGDPVENAQALLRAGVRHLDTL